VVADSHAHADGPGQDADEVGVHQGADRVIDHAQQQALQDLGDPAGGGDRHIMGRQYQVRREQGAGHHRNHGRGKGAQQVEEEDRADVGFLAVLVVGNRSHDQHEHQDWGDGLERRDKHLADERGGLRRIRRKQGQGNPGDQADDDLGDQAGAFESLQKSRRGSSHSGISDFFRVP
jgi:hypothetical protein